jgi:hypothetical protein
MKQIALTQDKYAVVDDEDYEFLNQWKWWFSSGYARRCTYINKVRSKMIPMQSLILRPKKGKLVDHIDGNKLNNQRNNLRLVTVKQNNFNKVSKVGESCYKGVCKKTLYPKKYYSCVNIGRKQYQIGYFDNERHAAIAYDMWATYFHKEFANTNFRKVGGT